MVSAFPPKSQHLNLDLDEILCGLCKTIQCTIASFSDDTIFVCKRVKGHSVTFVINSRNLISLQFHAPLFFATFAQKHENGSIFLRMSFCFL